MAASHAKHGTMTADAVTAVELTGAGDGLWIYNRTPELGELWATTNGTTPAIDGDGSWHVTDARWIEPRFVTIDRGIAVVMLISAAPNRYSVESGRNG